MGIRAKNFFWVGILLISFWSTLPAISADVNPNPPASPIKLIFIHHSTGENWLADYDGGLGVTLRDNNYFVSDTNYGWGPNSIGDLTDIGHWWLWFQGSNSIIYTDALYQESNQHSEYSRLRQDPGGVNDIIMFKSCFPNSHLEGSPDDLPSSGSNPLRGEDCWSQYHSVANAKGIYTDLLSYFSTRQDKLFIVISAPPLCANETDSRHASNARAFNNWLVNEWLKNYPYRNVAVFDFFNVLTSNGGNRNTNDANQTSGNHHRWWNGIVQHVQTVDQNTSAYSFGAWDSHPTTAGNRKAAQEFVSMLNIYYHCWRGTGDCPGRDSDNIPPVIDSFTSDHVKGNAPLTINFTCMAHDPDGAIVQFRWDFNGDGQIDETTSQGVCNRTFESEGIFQVTCSVVDNLGVATVSSVLTITITRGKGTLIRR